MELIRYDAARKALQQAATIDEAKDIRDKAEALKVYARQREDKDMEIWLAEIRLRADRRIGELSLNLEKITPEDKGKVAHSVVPISGYNSLGKLQVLADAGISQSTASRCEAIASFSEKKLDELINHAREIRKPLRQRDVLLEINREKVRVKKSLDTQDIKGKYSTIVIDPPWPMQKIRRDERPNQLVMDYPVMTLEQIEALTLPATDDCHVFLWATQKFLPCAFNILKSWGVKYVFTMVWHKPGGYQPFGLPQYNCEFVLYGRLGTPAFADTKSFNTCFNAQRSGHSEKPECFYELLCRTTQEPRVDLFSRREIDGFDSWGNEVPHGLESRQEMVR